MRNDLKAVKIHASDKKFIESDDFQISAHRFSKILMIFPAAAVSLDEQRTDDLLKPLVRLYLI